MPAHVLFEGVAKKLPFAQLVLKELLPEVAGEEVATLTQNFGEWAMLPSNKNKTAMDYVREQPSAMAATLVSTLVMFGGTAAMGHVVGHAGTIIEQATGQSKLRERSPGAMEELVTKGVDGTNLSHVYMDPQTFTEYWQSQGVDPKEAAAALTGNPDAYQAIEKGQQLVVPMGKYIAQVAGTEHGKFWSQEIRLGDAESMNLREFQQQDEVQAQMAETAGEAQAQAAAQPTARDHLVQALVAHGEPQRNAEQVADLWMGFFHNIAERAGIGPIYQRYGIRFQRPDMPGGQPVVTISAEAPPKTATTVSHEERQQNKRAAFEMLVEHERQQPADSSEQAIARDPEGAHAERATERLAKWQALTDERGEPMFVYRMPNGSVGVRPSSTGRNENVVATLYPTPAEAAATPAPAQQGPQVTIERPGAPAVTHGERRERIPAGQQTGLEHVGDEDLLTMLDSQDEAVKKPAQREILRRINTDALTGLGSEVAFKKAEERAKAEGMHVAVFDANNFKGYNDIHGHSAGNQLLITIGEKIKQAATEFGFGERVFRPHGDEFIVIAPPDKIEKIRERAEQLVGVLGYGPSRRTGKASAPISLSGATGPSFDEADAGLAAAKVRREAEIVAEAGERSPDYAPNALELIDTTTTAVQTERTADEVDTAGPAAAVETGEGTEPGDREGERQAPDEGARPAAETGVAPSGGVGGVSTDLSERVTGELRGLPGLNETFDRRPVAENQARLTPAVRRELGRIIDELDTFPFTSDTWNDLSKEFGLRGNVAGGHMERVKGGGGAIVYHDILAFSPVNTKTVKGERVPARQTHGSRADVGDAVLRVLESGDIRNNLAEGAVRVAEHRAVDDWRLLSSDITVLPYRDTAATISIPDLEAQTEAEILHDAAEPRGEVDTSFDPTTLEQRDVILPTGEVQPPLIEGVREQEIATPTFEAPFALTGETATPKPPDQGELFQMAEAATAVENVAALDAMVPVAQAGSFPTRRDLKVHIQQAVQQAAQAAGANIDPSTPEGHAYLVGIALRDALTSLQTNSNAVGWYDEKTQQALAVAALIYPELNTDVDARFAFTYALAVHSNGLTVNQNFELADAAYRSYRRTGKMPTNLGIGAAKQQMRKATELFNEKVKQWGLSTFRQFMVTEFTVSELRRLGLDASGEAANSVVRGAAAIGPKIGNGFFSNLNGFFDALTIDRWLMRTWGRWTGQLFYDTSELVPKKRAELSAAVEQLVARAPAQARLFSTIVGTDIATLRTPEELDQLGQAIRARSADPALREQMSRTALGDEVRRHGNMLGAHLDGQKEAPENPVERSQIRAVFSDMLAELHQLGTGMTTADQQALLWYAERRLYDAGTSEAEVSTGYEDREAPDYANAASTLARSKGISQDAIDGAMAGIARPADQAAGRAGTARRGDAAVEAPLATAGEAGQAARRGFTPAEREAFLARYAKAPHARAVHLTPTLAREARAESLELFQPDTPAASTLPAGFYSRLQRAVELSPQTKASGAQWKATIKNAKIGINRDEFALTNVDDLEDGTTYTKQEIIDYLARNAVKVEPVVLGATPAPTWEQIRARTEEIHERMINEKVQEIEEGGFTDQEVPYHQADARYNEDEGAWEAFVDDDNRSLPYWYDTEDEALEAAQAEADRLRDADEDEAYANIRERARDMVRYDDAEDQAREELDQAGEKTDTRYSEYQEPGAEPGSYREVFLTAANVETLTAPVGQRAMGWEDGHEQYRDIENPIVRLRYNIKTTTDGQRVLFLEEVQPPHPDEQAKMPQLFQKNWRDMAFKYALHVAAEQGLDGVAWTTGEQQAARYSLERQVRSIEWNPSTEDDPEARGVTHVAINTPGGLARVWLDEKGQIVNVYGVAPDRWMGESIADVVGKEIATQILGAPQGKIEGEGLKIGGEGLKKLYDVDFKNVVKGLPAVKRTGGQVGTVTISNAQRYELVPAGARWRLVNRFTNIFEGPVFSSGADAEAWLKEHDPQAPEQPAVMFTPEMREAVLGGQALFQGDEGEAGGEAPPPEPAPAAPARPPRGSIVMESGREGRLREFTINQFSRANLSTLLHETGHMFFRIMGDVAEQLAAVDPEKLSPSQQQLLTDYQAMLDFVGATSIDTMTRDQHEKFARAFEQYLREGTAPSLELRSAFASFRAWLVSIYKTALALRVDINPEIRQVFDRMLATEEQIAQAEAAANVQPMFTTAEQAGMTPAEFAVYSAKVGEASQRAREILERKLMADVKREQTAAYRAKLEQVRGEVETQVHALPVYRALAAMQYGTHPDGTPFIEGEEPVPSKLSKQILVERYGAERLKTLPKPYIYTREGGLDPDLMAEIYGYSSGDEMLTAVAAAPPMQQAIAQQTAQRMHAEYGSTLTDGTLPAEAQAAVLNDGREEIIRAELHALEQLQRRATRGPVAAARAEERQAGRTAQRDAVAAARKEGADALAAEKKERAYERRWFEAESRLRIAMQRGYDQVKIDALRDEVEGLHQELQALRATTRGGAATIARQVPSAVALREAARVEVARTRVKDIRPQVFWTAARNASQEATAAAARQDFPRAIRAKQQELYNTALYREATRALADVEARVKAARALGKGPARERLGRAGESYLDQVDGILDRYEFARVSQAVLDRRARIEKWVAALEGEGFPVDLPPAVLEDARRINYRDVAYEELVGITDGLKQIAHLARLKNKLLTAKDKRDFATKRAAIVDSIEDATPTRPKAIAIRLKDKPARVLNEWYASHTKLAEFIASLEGYVAGGPLWDAIMRPINEAATRQAVMHEAAATVLGDALTAAYTGRELAALRGPGITASTVGLGKDSLLYIPAIKDSLTKEERLAVALNWGNAGNRQRLMESGQRNWNAAQVQAILDTLDARDLKFVQAVLDHVNSYWAQIAAKQQRVTGIAPEKVAPASWTHSRLGEQRGGYYPIAYDTRLSVRASAIVDADSANLQQHAAYTYATTRRGHTEARLAKVNQPVRLELSVAFEHVEQVIHDLTHHEMLIDVGRLLADRQIATAIVDHAGDIVYKKMRAAVQDVALGTRHATTVADRALNYVRNGTTIAGLGWNFWTSVQQPIGLLNAAAIIGPKWVLRGAYRFLRDTTSMEWSSRWVYAKSEMMRLRGDTMQRDIAELRSTITQGGSWFDAALRTVTANKLEQRDITDSFLWLIEKAQSLADIPTWIGAYEKYRSTGESEDRAVALADQAVLDSQSGGQIKDLAEVQRGVPAFKLFTAFYSYGNLIFNQTGRIYQQTDFKRVGSVGQFAGNLALLYAFPAFLTVLLAHAFGKDDDDNWLAAMGREMLATALNTMVLVREFGSTARMLTGKQAGGTRGYEGPTGLRIVTSLQRFAQQVQQGEADKGLVRATEDAAGIIFKLPLGQVQRSVDGFTALEQGKTANPLAVLTGPPPKKASGQ
jgi:GGDEF domain-containing protein